MRSRSLTKRSADDELDISDNPTSGVGPADLEEVQTEVDLLNGTVRGVSERVAQLDVSVEDIGEEVDSVKVLTRAQTQINELTNARLTLLDGSVSQLNARVTQLEGDDGDSHEHNELSDLVEEIRTNVSRNSQGVQRLTTDVETNSGKIEDLVAGAEGFSRDITGKCDTLWSDVLLCSLLWCLPRSFRT